MNKRAVMSIEEARDVAIEWQKWASEEALSYSELIEWQNYFQALAKRWDLQNEFKENGII